MPISNQIDCLRIVNNIIQERVIESHTCAVSPSPITHSEKACQITKEPPAGICLGRLYSGQRLTVDKGTYDMLAAYIFMQTEARHRCIEKTNHLYMFPKIYI